MRLPRFLRKSLDTVFAALVPSLRYSWMGFTYERAVHDGFTNPFVYRAVTFLSEAVAELEWTLYQVRGDDYDEVRPDHQVYNLLSRPAPYTSGSQLLSSVCNSLLMSGTAFIAKVKTTSSGTKELWVLQPDCVSVNTNDQETAIASFSYEAKSRTYVYQPEEMIYLRFAHPLDRFGGWPPMAAAAKSIDQNNEARTWNMGLLKNGARPSGIVTGDSITPAQRDMLQEALESKYAAAMNAGRPLVLGGGLQWQPVSLTPADMDYLDLQKLTAREISVVFKLPPEILGDESSKTYSNYREARKAAYTEAVLPLASYIRDEMNVQLVREFGEDLWLDYERDKIEALSEERSQAWERVKGASFLTIDEQRAELGYEPLPENLGNTVLVPTSVVPLDILGATPAATEDVDEL